MPLRILVLLFIEAAVQVVDFASVITRAQFHILYAFLDRSMRRHTAAKSCRKLTVEILETLVDRFPTGGVLISRTIYHRIQFVQTIPNRPQLHAPGSSLFRDFRMAVLLILVCCQ